MHNQYDIILVLPHSGYHGLAIKAHRLINEWQKHNRRVLVIAFKEAAGASPIAHYPDKIVFRKYDLNDPPSRFQKLPTLIQSLVQLRSIFRKHRNTPIVSLGGDANTKTCIASLGLNNEVYIALFVDPKTFIETFGFKLQMRLLFKGVKGVLVNVNANAKALQEAFPQYPYHKLPNLIPRSLLMSENTQKQPILLTVGRFIELKGQHLIIEAFSKIAPIFPDWQLYLLGSGPNKHALQEQIIRHQLEPQILLLDEDPNPAPVYQKASIYIQYSSSEGFTGSLLEAMASGCCCITADSSEGPLELVKHNANGLVVPYPDINQLSLAMERLMSDPSLRNRLTADHENSVSPFFSDRAIEEWNQLLFPTPPKN